MYRIFLVEDEIVVREGMREFIDWERYGFSLIGDAPDGELAWAAIQKSSPDVVITDIKMPFMDGLQLSERIRQEFPETVVIILSGYDDFSYAKEAIRNGVSRYLLKPLSKEQLIEVLIEVREKKDAERRRQESHEKLESEMQSFLESARHAFFEMLTQDGTAVSELLERAQKLGISLSASAYNMVLYLIEQKQDASENETLLAARARMKRVIGEEAGVEVFCAGMGVFALLVQGEPAQTEETVAHICSILEDLQNEVPALRVRVSCGAQVQRISAIASCYKDARERLLFQAEAVQMPAETPSEIIDNLKFMDFDAGDVNASAFGQEQIHRFLASAKAEEVQAFVERHFSTFGEEALRSLLFRYYIVLNIQFAVNAFCEKHGLTAASVTDTQAQKQALAEALSTLERSKSYVCNLLTQTVTLRSQSAGNRYGDMMQTVLAYMQAHYSSADMGLNTVAAVANVTPTHFSTLFSQQTGKTFVEYLTGLRMDKARELLRCTSISSSEIAYQVGYKDPHYFSSLFKKLHGCTPRDYRKGKEGERA